MEYHEIGERFKYNGVVLEVIEVSDCASCFFDGGDRECKLKDKLKYCGVYTRNDDKSISYKLVVQCKLKDMEQETQHSNNTNLVTYLTQQVSQDYMTGLVRSLDTDVTIQSTKELPS